MVDLVAGVSRGEGQRKRVGELDGGRAVVTDPDVGTAFDPVGVVPGAFDHTRVGPVFADGVEMSLGGDVLADLGEDDGLAVRGEMPPSR
jgi:hypothetical protein